MHGTRVLHRGTQPLVGARRMCYQTQKHNQRVYEVLKANNFFIKKTRSAFTTNAGRYTFAHKVPIGYLINVTLVSDDMHFHPGKQNPPRICKYKAIEKAVDTGNVALEVIPKDWEEHIQVNFTVKPDSVHDPCDGAYP